MKKLHLLAILCLSGLLANAQCQAAFTYTINGGTVSFTNTSSYSVAVTSQWNFGDNSLDNSANPAPHTYQFAGTYVVCLNIHDTMPSTCSSTFCDTIVITGAPNPPCNAVFQAVVDSNATATVWFNNAWSQYNAEWFWDFGDGNHDSTSGSYVSHQYASQDTFATSLTVVTTMGDTCTYNDTVIAIPCWQKLNTGFTVQLSGSTVTFVNSSNGAGHPTYNWSFGDGGYSSQAGPTHTYQYNGTFPVCLSYADSGTNCSEMYCDTLVITSASNYPCFALFSYMPDTFASGSVTFQDQSSINIVSWNWSFPGGSPSSSTSAWAQVTYPPGTYTATLTVVNQSGISCTYSNTVNVGTNCAGTQAYFTMQPDTVPQVWVVNNMSTGAGPISYTWNWGDGSPNSTGATPSHTYAQAGWYTICMTLVDANGCGSSYCSNDSLYKFNATGGIISVYVIQTATGVNNIAADGAGASVYPNPTSGELTVYGIPFNAEKAEVYNAFGQVVYQKTLNRTEEKIDLSLLPRGVYWLTLSSGDRTITRKVVLAGR